MLFVRCALFLAMEQIGTRTYTILLLFFKRTMTEVIFLDNTDLIKDNMVEVEALLVLAWVLDLTLVTLTC